MGLGIFRRAFVVRRFGEELAQLDTVQQAGQLIEHLGEIRCKFSDMFDLGEQSCGIVGGQRLKQDLHLGPLDRAQHRMHLRSDEAATAKVEPAATRDPAEQAPAEDDAKARTTGAEKAPRKTSAPKKKGS